MLARALKSISIHSVLQPSSRKRTKAMFTDLTSKKKKKRGKSIETENRG